MSAQLRLHPGVFHDVEGHVAYIAKDNPDAAMRFHDAVQSTYDQITRFPALGTFHQAIRPRATGVRKMLVPGFYEYMVLYRIVSSDLVEVLRVAHRARDVGAMLESAA